ncbi:hypothetical protein M8J76_015575 [Diaphorina citri]|nr:hypothetical protein M8J76_015575 [Diaphorina citri]
MFGSLMRFVDGEEDDILGAHMQNMNQMMSSMNSMFANPFGMMGGHARIWRSLAIHANDATDAQYESADEPNAKQWKLSLIQFKHKESEAFNQEWRQKACEAQLLQHSVNYPQTRHQALPDANGSSSRHSSSSRHHRQHSPMLAIQSAPQPQPSRKRDHSGADKMKPAAKKECNSGEQTKQECNRTSPAPPSGETKKQSSHHGEKKLKTGE